MGHHPWCPHALVANAFHSRSYFEVARPTYISFRHLKHRSGEPLQDYIRLFRQMQNRVHNLLATSVIMVFYLNIRNTKVREEMAAHWVHTVAELYALA